MKTEDRIIYHKHKECISSSGESTEIIIIINATDGTTKVKLEKSYSEYFDITDLDKAEDLYETLNGSGYVIDIERLAKLRRIKED